MGGAVVDDEPSDVKAPDGGWGWAVLAGGFVITGFSYAFPKAVSVFFKELIREFGVGYSDCAWISSILLAMLYGTGPLCSVLVNKFGCRPVMMVGGLFASLGMILASLATSIIHIYLCTGVITGLGLALNFQPSLIMLNRYFSEKRPLANGLSAAGSPVALCCLSPLGQVLHFSSSVSLSAVVDQYYDVGRNMYEHNERCVKKINTMGKLYALLELRIIDIVNVFRHISPPKVLQYHYGWRGGFLILGGLLLNCCACGALMRPLVGPKKPQVQELQAVDQAEKKPKPLKKLLDFSVFKDRGFLIYAIAASIMVLGLFVPPVFVVSYAKEMGNEDTKSALLLTILGFVDIFARPTCGLIAGMKWVRPRCVYLFSFAILFNGITDVVSSQATDYPGLVVFCIFFGLSYGMVGALQFEVLMAIVGTKKFSSALGLVLLMEAIAVLVGPPGAGRLLDTTHNYMHVFLLAGCEVILASIVICLGNFLCIKKKPDEPEAHLENGAPAEMEKLNSLPEGGKTESEQPDGDISTVTVFVYGDTPQ
uniref:Solute carrier family 16 member 3 n=1 Tax=Oncorhynchus mykiss TaxID=8022 RepID=A0A8C7VYE0_ONCMY